VSIGTGFGFFVEPEDLPTPTFFFFGGLPRLAFGGSEVTDPLVEEPICALAAGVAGVFGFVADLLVELTFFAT
jgi:hypothetical protein